MKDKPTGSAPPPNYPPDQRPVERARAGAENQAQEFKATSEQEFDQFKQAAGQKTEQTKTSFKEEAHHMAEEAKDAGSKIVAHQKQSLVTKIRQYEEAIRAAATTLREEEENILVGPAEQAANQLERAAGYLQNHQPGDFLHDLEGLARRRPEFVFGGLFLAGFATSRFLKASRRKPRSKTTDTARDFDPSQGAAMREPGSSAEMPQSPVVTTTAPPRPTQPTTYPLP